MRHLAWFRPPALRSATFGSWRMLTLGSEYEDTWAPAPSLDKGRSTSKRVYEEPEPEETEELSWRSVAKDSVQKYDTVLHLDGVSREGTGDGVHKAVRKHDILNNAQWAHRTLSEPPDVSSVLQRMLTESDTGFIHASFNNMQNNPRLTHFTAELQVNNWLTYS